MHGTADREFVVSDRFQRYVEIVRELMKKCYNSLILLVIYYDFWQKKQVKIVIVPLFRLKFDDVTVTLSLIVLS